MKRRRKPAIRGRNPKRPKRNEKLSEESSEEDVEETQSEGDNGVLSLSVSFRVAWELINPRSQTLFPMVKGWSEKGTKEQVCHEGSYSSEVQIRSLVFGKCNKTYPKKKRTMKH